jgi:hypothetical protein
MKNFYIFLASLAVVAGLAQGAAINIPVSCGAPLAQVGVITVQNNAGSVSGNFSTAPNPPNAGSLAAAAAACGEDHFNWYQVVTADNQAPTDINGNQLAAPYVDTPPGGYSLAADPTWADALPWYYDEGPVDSGSRPECQFRAGIACKHDRDNP